jgi:hypothetical protein
MRATAKGGGTVLATTFVSLNPATSATEIAASFSVATDANDPATAQFG